LFGKFICQCLGLCPFQYMIERGNTHGSRPFYDYCFRI
jgi:hypothetical protein